MNTIGGYGTRTTRKGAVSRVVAHSIAEVMTGRGYRQTSSAEETFESSDVLLVNRFPLRSVQVLEELADFREGQS